MWNHYACSCFCFVNIPIYFLLCLEEEPVDVEYSDSTTDGEYSDASSRESDQSWDVDSFDEGTDFKPPTKTAPSDEEIEKMRLYRPQMYKNKVLCRFYL